MSGANDAALAKSLRWREQTEVSGYIDRAAWLSDDLLLLIGWFHAEPAEPLSVGALRRLGYPARADQV